MSRNENVWTDAKCAALRVEFLTSREELFLYAKAIYFAMMWGREVNEKNRVLQEKEFNPVGSDKGENQRARPSLILPNLTRL